MITALVLAFLTTCIVAVVFYLIGYHRGLEFGKTMAYMETTNKVLDKLNDARK